MNRCNHACRLPWFFYLCLMSDGIWFRRTANNKHTRYISSFQDKNYIQSSNFFTVELIFFVLIVIGARYFSRYPYDARGQLDANGETRLVNRAIEKHGIRVKEDHLGRPEPRRAAASAVRRRRSRTGNQFGEKLNTAGTRGEICSKSRNCMKEDRAVYVYNSLIESTVFITANQC